MIIFNFDKLKLKQKIALYIFLTIPCLINTVALSIVDLTENFRRIVTKWVLSWEEEQIV